MLTLSTHDTKRSADVRARLNVLSEIPDAWRRGGRRGGREHNERHRARRLARPQRRVPPLPDARRRVADRRRPGRSPSWRRRPTRPRCTPRGPTPCAELRRRGRGASCAASSPTPAFVADLERFLAEHHLVERGRRDLARPDGAAADLSRRARPLPGQRAAGTSASSTPTTAGRSTSTLRRQPARRARATRRPPTRRWRRRRGGPKLWLIHRLLDHRRRRPELLRRAAYEPLPVGGRPRATHVVAFSRGDLVVVVPRLLVAWTAPVGRHDAVDLPDGRVDRRARRGATLRRRHAAGRPSCSARFPVAVLGAGG